MISIALLGALAARNALAAPAATAEPLLREAARQVEALESFSKTVASAAWPTGGWYVSTRTASDYCLASPATLTPMSRAELELQGACEAFVRDDLDVCQDLRPDLTFSRGAGVNCRRAFADLAIASGADAFSPDAGRRCVEGIETAFALGTPEDFRHFCAVVSGGGSVAAVCEELHRRVPTGFPTRANAGCEKSMSYLLEGRDCGHFRPEEFQRGLCPTFAAFRRARVARDPGLCGDDFLCRALMGDRGACSDRRRTRTRSYCAGAVVRRPPAAEDPFRRAVEAQIAATLTAADDMLFDPAEKEAMRRLHARMLGASPIEARAAADVFTVLNGRIEDLLYRSESLLDGRVPDPGTAASREILAGLKERFAAARKKPEARLE